MFKNIKAITKPGGTIELRNDIQREEVCRNTL